MRIATWNVNSIRSRIDRVEAWLERSDVDVLAIQETKAREDQFPLERFEALGYEVAHDGLNQWNGVAIASRVGLTTSQVGFDGHARLGRAGRAPRPARSAPRCDGIRVWSLYVPNGRALDDPHLVYKLDWLGRLRAPAGGWLAERPGAQIALIGDWNIAPSDADVWSMAVLRRQHARLASASAPPSRASSTRLHRRRPPACERARHLHLLGLHAAALPEAAGHADRLRTVLPRPRRARRRGRHRPRGAQGQGRVGPRPGRLPGRGVTELAHASMGWPVNEPVPWMTTAPEGSKTENW